MFDLASAQMAAHSTFVVLAQAQPEPPEGPEFGKASPIGIPVVLLLLIATVLLVWNMNSRLKNLPESFDEDHPEPDQLADEGTDPLGVTGDRMDLPGNAERSGAAEQSPLDDDRRPEKH